MAWIKKSDYLIIIPAYNEEETIETLVVRAKEYGDVCVINDCSSDRTPQILKQFDDIKVIDHKENTHIPGAIVDGMKFAIEHGYAYGITIDAGLSHNPDEIPAFMESAHADLLIGLRIKKTNTPLFRRLLSGVGNLIYNICLDFPRSLIKKTYYRDISSGFRRYSNKAMKLLASKSLKSRSFDFLFESTMLIYNNRLTINNVPITYDFSNSSLNSTVVKDCLLMSLSAMVNKRSLQQL